MELKGKKIILASNSPRRRELLAGMDVEFTVDTRNNFDEKWDPSTPHDQVPALMAEGKSNGFWRELEKDEILITSDTMVLMDKMIMGKPHSREQAVEMLQSLSGNTHEVISAVTVRDGLGRKETFSDVAYVSLKELTLAEIDYYIDNYKPFDKAGAYGIQEWIGYIGITKLEGSFYTVMGFPVHRVYDTLLRFI
ncbi:MAG: Maf family protein [Bacteroidales bacterium]|nr:Maf family protein [Bacteroidales bacterium]